MRAVGIDLAERMSAAVVIDYGGTVLYETCLDAGKQEDPPNPWKNITAVRSWFSEIEQATVGHPTKWVVETPHFHARNGEPALLVQGGLLSTMIGYGIDYAAVWRIPAMEWQHYFGYTKAEHGDTKAWASMYAETYLDYTPGCTWPEGSRMIKKMREDLVDARLLAEWLRLTNGP